MKKKKLKKPGLKPLRPHEVKTVAAPSLDKKHSCTSSSSSVLRTAATNATVSSTSRKPSSSAVLRTDATIVTASITSRKQNQKPWGRHPSLSLERDPQAQDSNRNTCQATRHGPSSAVFAGTKSDTSMSSSAAVYAVTKSGTCKDSPCVYAETKSDTSKNSPALMYAATKSDTGKKHKKQNSPSSPQETQETELSEFNPSHMQSNSSSQSEYQPTSLKDTHSSSLIHAEVELECLAETCNMGKSWDGDRYKTEKVPLWMALELMKMHMEYAHPCTHTPNSTAALLYDGHSSVNIYDGPCAVAPTHDGPSTVPLLYNGHSSVNIYDGTSAVKQETRTRNTEPADTPALNFAGDVWGELSPGSPGLNNDPNPRNTETQKHRNTGGTAQSPSSHPSHHDKVVDESPSGSKVNEETIMEQPTKTSTVNILMEALQELATVHGLLLGADQDKLYSPDIMKAAMTELTSVTCLLQDNLQKCQNQQDSSSCLKGGGGNNYTTHSSSNNTETTSPISYSHPDKVVDINSNTVSSLMTSSPDTKLEMLKFSYSHHDKVVDIDPRQEANSQEDSALQILPSAPRQHSLPATIYKVCTENQPNYSNLVTYKDLVYMLEDMFDDSYRISLSEDISQSVLSYTQNTMPVPEAAFTYSNQTKMNETVPYQDLVLYSQPEPSPHLQCPEEELLNYVMPENQDSRFLQSPRGGGHNRSSHISALQF